MSALDVGSVLHRVAEKYIAVMDKEQPEKAAERLLAAALAETGKADADVNKKLVTLLRKEAARMCRGIYDQVRAGSSSRRRRTAFRRLGRPGAAEWSSAADGTA